ncbi:unnamed protein product [Spirodela intermedia]|uniref:Uncharacterized protein n=1 Tax=Spirodela intermedia TaxID=51605 RepID=A0A7I8JAV6_SPIIN|nr:unnamed protein product [Spirodela intermedia]CAA6666573.1 unnamed protein product [Spirodela intermedia]
MDTAAALLVLSAIAAYVIWFSYLSRTLKGPRVWPILGSLPGLVQNCHRMHDWIAENLRASGGTYQTCIFAVPGLARRQGIVTVTCDPRNVEHVLKLRFENYPKGPTWHAVFHDLLGDGIFNSDGDTWRFQRKTAALEFTTRTLRQAMVRWGRGLAGSPPTADLRQHLRSGLRQGPETLSPGLPENGFAAAFDRATEATLHRFIIPEFMWRLKKWLRLGMEVTLSRSLSHVDDYLSKVIAGRKLELARAGGPHRMTTSSPGSCARATTPTSSSSTSPSTSSSPEGTPPPSRSAGSSTSSSRTPRRGEDPLRDLRRPRRNPGEDDPAKWVEEPLAFEEVDKLIYLKAALSETLRLYPSVPEDSKHVMADDVLPDGTFVPAGSSITYSIYSTGRMKFIWGEDCMEFRPERWLTADGKRFDSQDSFKFVAFNAGPRICLGKDLAYLQMKSIAAAVLLRHRLTVAPGHRVEQKMSLTLFMKHGLMVNLHRRDLAQLAESLKVSARGRDCGAAVNVAAPAVAEVGDGGVKAAARAPPPWPTSLPRDEADAARLCVSLCA